MNYLFIRPFIKDDYLARLCYESWILSGYEGKVIMYAEEPFNKKNERVEYNWIKGIGEYIERKETNNFGGQMGAWSLIMGLRNFTYKDDDIIISCDADIIIKDNPLNIFAKDFGGKGGVNHRNGIWHISGQCMIMRGWVVNKIISIEEDKYQMSWGDLEGNGSSICDDTYFSYIAEKNGAKFQVFPNNWVHDKPYHLEPRTD